ncbi:Ubiquitin carboxyl-terminal hydrolase 48 [Dissophora globulifera]|uniref:ubiquitinyl hydrolase 1 n=1 Tax=Dissophora globulifera TaxID=979702 RepID=A0A9P6RWY8_9FUNG|nr:Ubiquitin carboxyl-terminal hydrolase 48 [Dissophora globulifera]
MAPFGKKSDKQWSFLGVEVNDIKDLTPAHIRAVYGLGPSSTHRGSEGTSSQPSHVDESTSAIFPYCENHYTASALTSSSTSTPTKTGAFNDYFAAVANKPDPEVSKRAESSPGGMKNLGATCYANSLLQVWFHDLAFRDAIYRCRFNENTDKSMSALYQLQLLFVHLDRGLKDFYNPLSLINALKLDTATQQDAQEFCNLFMAQIDNQFQKQPDFKLSEFITNQFQGHYSYNTTCKNCKKTSKRDCTYYELMLNIKDNCTLMDCFEEFIEAEDLVGSDRYFCSTCGSLQDASRAIKLEKLPNVLNIQLMRFVYDNVTWTKKKSKDTIKFPSTINFSELLGVSESVESDKWFVLNDEEVAEFHGTKFDPEDYSDAATKPKPKQNGVKSVKNAKSVGTDAEKHLSTLSSRNAYMLTYTKRTSKAPVKPCPPAETLDVVTQENEVFKTELAVYAQYKEQLGQDFERTREKRRELYRSWHVTSDEDKSCYVSAESLANYLKLQGETARTIDSSSLCCEHGKLDPAAVLKSKRISEAARRLLEERDGITINPLLTTENTCTLCTQDLCQDKLYSWMHRRDVEEFERKAKGVRSPMTAWISKAWLADWSKALQVLTRIFGSMPLPDNDAVECAECRHQLQPHLNDMKDMIARAASEKSELSEMIMRGARVREMEPGRNYYVISQEFMRKWIDFVKRPTVNKRPATIDHSSLMCKHKLFVFDLNNVADAENVDDIAVIKEEEWAYLHAMYGGGPEVTVIRSEMMQLDDDVDTTENGAILVTTPGLCRDCRNERILDFSSTTLIVRVYSPGEGVVESNGTVTATAELTAKGATVTETPLETANKANLSKRKQAMIDTGSRRSKRTKATKKPYREIKIVVSKWDSVMDVKLKIMQKTDIVPLYQKLVHGCEELDRNDKTIADLEIPPHAVLDVVAFDQRTDDLALSTLQDETPMPGDEGGFGGTGLAEEWL